MLLYLAKDTFTSAAGDALAEEVRRARQSGVSYDYEACRRSAVS